MPNLIFQIDKKKRCWMCPPQWRQPTIVIWTTVAPSISSQVTDPGLAIWKWEAIEELIVPHTVGDWLNREHYGTTVYGLQLVLYAEIRGPSLSLFPISLFSLFLFFSHLTFSLIFSKRFSEGPTKSGAEPWLQMHFC